jgi:hypothetical protein
MKTTDKKDSTNILKTGNFSHAPVTIKSIKNIFKFNRVLQIQNAELISTVRYTQIEKNDSSQIEAETRRDQGRIYANTTPIR